MDASSLGSRLDPSAATSMALDNCKLIESLEWPGVAKISTSCLLFALLRYKKLNKRHKKQFVEALWLRKGGEKGTGVSRENASLFKIP
jgi:hypothetical protein